jgi:prepilin-type processing-associated H-X9-DG protein
MNAIAPDSLLEAALNQLEPADADRLDRALEADAALADRLAQTRAGLGRLLDDGEGPEPPVGLAGRALARVAAEGHRTAPRRPVLEFAPARIPFRWADVAVAAGIFLASLITLIPAIQRGQWRMQQSACEYNLHTLGVALAQYSGDQGSYPYLEDDSPASCAGAYPVLLGEAGLLPGVAHLDCPGNGRNRLPNYVPTLADLRVQEERSPVSSPLLCDADYAYHLGYRTPSGRERPVAVTQPGHLQSLLPLLGDRPAHRRGPGGEVQILDGNSPNHGGAGQNVLFADGSVRWHPTRRLGPVDADIFLNDQRRPAPGVKPFDAVLAPGITPFHCKD